MAWAKSSIFSSQVGRIWCRCCDDNWVDRHLVEDICQFTVNQTLTYFLYIITIILKNVTQPDITQPKCHFFLMNDIAIKWLFGQWRLFGRASHYDLSEQNVINRNVLFAKSYYFFSLERNEKVESTTSLRSTSTTTIQSWRKPRTRKGETSTSTWTTWTWRSSPATRSTPPPIEKPSGHYLTVINGDLK